MNPFLLLLLQAGINIANGHVKNKAGGEVLDLTSFILDAARAIDSLHQEEVGEPLDWSKIREHQPLAPAGEEPHTTAPVPPEEIIHIDEDGTVHPPEGEATTEVITSADVGEMPPEFLGDPDPSSETPEPSVPEDPPPSDPPADGT